MMIIRIIIILIIIIFIIIILIIIILVIIIITIMVELLFLPHLPLTRGVSPGSDKITLTRQIDQRPTCIQGLRENFRCRPKIRLEECTLKMIEKVTLSRQIDQYASDLQGKFVQLGNEYLNRPKLNNNSTNIHPSKGEI